MKKFKLLPSLIMLVLCIGVLAVGVYALTPISNSIAGTISISAGKASIAITGYIDNTEVYPRTELHEGMEWAIASSNLNFNASNYFFPEDVPSKAIRLKIENLSSVPYGVFFCDHADVNATASNIKTAGEIKSISDSSKTIVNASMDYYKYISSTDSNSTLDQVDMTITLSVASLTASAQTGKFTYYLNIEEYNSNLNLTEEFIKIDDNLTSIEASAYSNNTTVKNVIIPNSITSIGANAFSGCTGLTEITIPSSVTTIGAGVFDGCTALEKIIVEAHTSAGNFGDSANLPKFDDMGWYIDTERQTSLIYSTKKIVYKLQEVPKITLTYEIAGSTYLGGTAEVVKQTTLSGFGTHPEGEEVTLAITWIDFPEPGITTEILGYNNSTDSWVSLVSNSQCYEGTVISYDLTVSATGYTKFKIAVYMQVG